MAHIVKITGDDVVRNGRVTILTGSGNNATQTDNTEEHVVSFTTYNSAYTTRLNTAIERVLTTAD